MTPEPEQPMTHEIGTRTYVVADVDPLDVDGTRTVAVGTVLWLVGFVGLLPFYSRLQEDGHLWWLWTCLAGFGLGLAGWDYCRRRRRHRLEQEPDEAVHAEPEASPAPYAGRRRAAPPDEAAPATGSEPVTTEPVDEADQTPVGVPSPAPQQKPPFSPR